MTSQDPIFPERLVTGLQPTMAIHLGHFEGAIRPCLRIQDQSPGECFVLVADLHYLSATRDVSRVSQVNLLTVRSLLALGVDPEKSIIYLQSHVPQACELMWILSCLIGKAALDRGHAYRAAVDRGKPASVGIFLYPLLQAADILSVRATHVPAGRDQQHHVELARSVARRINSMADVATLPEPVLIDAQAGLLPGTDGARKMSRQNENYVSVFEDEMVIASQINSCASLPLALGESVDADKTVAFRILSSFADEDLLRDVRSRLEAGALGMADLKELLLRGVIEAFAAARERFRELGERQDLIRDVLGDGAARARREVAETMLQVREILGIESFAR